MRALITGARGTVGSVLSRRVEEDGGTAIGWDRNEAPPGDVVAARHLVERIAPDVVFHVALPSQSTGMENEGWVVNEKWTSDIAALAAERGVPLVYASTVMVYTSRANGPFTPDMPPDETEGYGLSKLQGERAAQAANESVRVARFGWQIGRTRGGNNMLEHLEKQMAEQGEIAASTRWLPATSFLEDTAAALIQVARQPPGIYHINSNTRWNFFEIVSALNVVHGGRWKVRPTEDFVYDQRMLDLRLSVPNLEERLPQLLD